MTFTTFIPTNKLRTLCPSLPIENRTLCFPPSFLPCQSTDIIGCHWQAKPRQFEEEATDSLRKNGNATKYGGGRKNGVTLIIIIHYIYIALYIEGGNILIHHQCAASPWMMWQQPYCARTPTTHQLIGGEETVMKPISVWGWLRDHDGQRPVGGFAQDTGVTPLLFFWRTYIYIYDPLCENPAKVIFLSLILTVRSCQSLKW